MISSIKVTEKRIAILLMENVRVIYLEESLREIVVGILDDTFV